MRGGGFLEGRRTRVDERPVAAMREGVRRYSTVHSDELQHELNEVSAVGERRGWHHGKTARMSVDAAHARTSTSISSRRGRLKE